MEFNIKAYHETRVLKTIREGDAEDGGEGQFGLIPQTRDPNHALNPPTQTVGNELLGPKPHPLLSKSQRFSGIDRSLTPNPLENATAQEVYPQLRLQHQLQFKNQNKKSPPRLTR